jgi:uncharacterized membrane protein YqgA involved in biofilm formation
MRTCRSKIERRRGSKGFAVFGLILGGLLGELRKVDELIKTASRKIKKLFLLFFLFFLPL